MFYKASGIWPGDAARPAAASAGAVDPAESASRGQQWTPAAGGDRAQIIVRRDDILQLSRCTFAPRGADRLKNIVTQGVVSGI